MLSLHRRTWPRLYVDCLREALREGYARPSREGETVELGPAFLSCPAPVFVQLEGRGGSQEFARLEQLCYLAGEPPDILVSVAPRYVRFQEPNGEWPGAYGPRLALQLSRAVEELTRHPFTRRAVALVWNEMDMHRIVLATPRDVPCTVSLSFWIGPAGEVRAHAHMRSCDLWFGLYYDLPAFAFLQKAVARALSRPAGLTYLSATSLHLYNVKLDHAKFVHQRVEAGTTMVHAVLPEPVQPYFPDSAVRRFLWLQDWARAQLKEVKVNAPVG